jgi:hypothetical protein
MAGLGTRVSRTIGGADAAHSPAHIYTFVNNVMCYFNNEVRKSRGEEDEGAE